MNAVENYYIYNNVFNFNLNQYALNMISKINNAGD